MNIYPSFKYQLWTQKMTVIVYYAAYIGVTLLFGGASLISYGDSAGSFSVTTMNGLSAVTAVVAFMKGCCSFKGNFGMALQNGVSRRSLFSGRICATGVFCLVLAVCDEAFTLLFALFGKLPVIRAESLSLLETIYDPQWNRAALILGSVAFSFCLLLAASALGYFCSTLFYRLPAPGKVAVIVGAEFVFICGVPILKTIRDRFHLEALWEALCRGLVWSSNLAFGAAPNCMVFCLVVFVAFSAFAWLLMRRVPLKK